MDLVCSQHLERPPFQMVLHVLYCKILWQFGGVGYPHLPYVYWPFPLCRHVDKLASGKSDGSSSARKQKFNPLTWSGVLKYACHVIERRHVAAIWRNFKQIQTILRHQICTWNAGKQWDTLLEHKGCWTFDLWFDRTLCVAFFKTFGCVECFGESNGMQLIEIIFVWFGFDTMTRSGLIYFRKLQKNQLKITMFQQEPHVSFGEWFSKRIDAISCSFIVLFKDPRSPKCVHTFICKVKRLLLGIYRFWEGIFADTIPCVLVSPRLAQYLLRNHPTHTSDHRDAMCPPGLDGNCNANWKMVGPIGWAIGVSEQLIFSCHARSLHWFFHVMMLSCSDPCWRFMFFVECNVLATGLLAWYISKHHEGGSHGDGLNDKSMSCECDWLYGMCLACPQSVKPQQAFCSKQCSKIVFFNIAEWGKFLWQRQLLRQLLRYLVSGQQPV